METLKKPLSTLPPRYNSWLDLYRHLVKTNDLYNHTMEENLKVAFEYKIEGTSYEWPLSLIKARAFDELYSNLPSYSAMHSLMNNGPRTGTYPLEQQRFEDFLGILPTH